jgi:hypothetical protein
LKISDNGVTHCVKFFLDFIHHLGVIKTRKFWKLVLLPSSGETDWAFFLLSPEDGGEPTSETLWF